MFLNAFMVQNLSPTIFLKKIPQAHDYLLVNNTNY